MSIKFLSLLVSFECDGDLIRHRDVAQRSPINKVNEKIV